MKFTRIAVFSAFVLSCCVSQLASAQEQVQVFSFGTSIESDGEASGTEERVTNNISVGAPMMFGGGAPFGIDPNNRSALFNMLSNESVRQELQLKPEQYDGVKKVMAESQRQLSDMVRSNMSAGRIQLGSAFKELVEANRQQSETAIEEILLPEQLARARQLAYQVEIAQLGLGESLTNGRLGKEIDVHEDQKQHLTDKANAIEAEARQAIAKIRAAARQKLLAELAPEQRKKAEELLGPHFEYEEPSIAKTIHRDMQQRMQNNRGAVRITKP